MLPWTSFLDCKTGRVDWLCANACVPAAGGTAEPGAISGFSTALQIESAIINSILTWARDDDENANRINPRTPNGWWADIDSQFGVIGSRLYKLPYMDRSGATLAFAKSETERALQWMVDKGYTTRINAEASFATNRMILIQVHIDKESYAIALQTQSCLAMHSFKCTTKCR